MELALPSGLTSRTFCGVCAVATVAGIPVSKAEQLLRAAIRFSPRTKWTGSTSTAQRAHVLTQLGFKLSQHYTFTKEGRGKGQVTLTSWVRDWAAPGRTYLVVVTGHVVVVRDGMVLDQTGIHPAAKHRSARCHTQHVTEIL